MLQGVVGRTIRNRKATQAQPLLFLYPFLTPTRTTTSQYRPAPGYFQQLNACGLHTSGQNRATPQDNYNHEGADEDIPFADIFAEDPFANINTQNPKPNQQKRGRGRPRKAVADSGHSSRNRQDDDSNVDPWGYLFNDAGKEEVAANEKAESRRRAYKTQMDYEYGSVDDQRGRNYESRKPRVHATAEEREAFNEILTQILMRNEQQVSQLGGRKAAVDQNSPLLTALFQGIRGDKDELSFNPTPGVSATPRVIMKAPLKRKGNSQLFIEHLGLLRKSATDLEVWSFLEDHVFTVATSTHGNLQTSKSPKTSKTSKTSNSASKDSPKEKFTVPTENYADMIEAAMYILRVEFQDYSGSVSVFERVKQLGAESYVIGCSTGVYNELIEAQWAGYRDMQRIGEILEEMQSNGIPGDAKTASTVERAILEAKGIACNTDLPGGAPLWANIDAAAQVNQVKKTVSEMGFVAESTVPTI